MAELVHTGQPIAKCKGTLWSAVFLNLALDSLSFCKIKAQNLHIYAEFDTIIEIRAVAACRADLMAIYGLCRLRQIPVGYPREPERR